VQVDLPDDLFADASRLAEEGVGGSVVDVLRSAVSLLDTERAAIREGVQAWRAGDTADWDEFIAKVRQGYSSGEGK
jgi:Arc/MetJ-type ribon-helix-helix transcriptional regulator